MRTKLCELNSYGDTKTCQIWFTNHWPRLKLQNKNKYIELSIIEIPIYDL
jgi:hypothetical protein